MLSRSWLLLSLLLGSTGSLLVGCGGRSIDQQAGHEDGGTGLDGRGSDGGADAGAADQVCRGFCDCCGSRVEIDCALTRCELGVCDEYCLFDGGPSDGSGSDGGLPDGSGVDAGGAGPRGTCETDADCAEGSCVSVPEDPAGWRTCQSPPAVEATSCSAKGGLKPDECCTSAECTSVAGGGCYPGPRFYCGGAFPGNFNVCVYDECQADADCRSQTAGALGLCLPANVFGEVKRRCLFGDCRLDRDCQSRSGGQCLPFADPCSRRLQGFSCTYADSVCRNDADCPNDGSLGGIPYCRPGQDGQTACEGFAPPP